ncbi:hypothetical protein SCG7086_BN_00120 [Chlamydiales bacterium SCGC AG-110-P3]|nr:hypothetical protein SCG7086_BN_00120 [Chlamydiales bacterium SCGC AG-110-P3]
MLNIIINPPEKGKLKTNDHIEASFKKEEKEGLIGS